jgi:hypothetical protein
LNWGITVGDSNGAAIEALGRIAQAPSNIPLIVQSGGVQAVLGCLNRDPSSAQVALTTAQLLSTLSQGGMVLDELVDSTSIGSLLTSMRLHPGNIQLQTLGTKCLIALASSEQNVHTLLQNGAAELALANMSIKLESIELAKESMFLTASLLLTAGNTCDKPEFLS